MGGGTAGGFGVYEGPIRKLASGYGVTLADLSRQPIELVLLRLRAGRPVMAWIGLSEGLYKRWRTPSGKLITVNFGEHVVVLTGMRGAMINVNDPLTGTRLQWTVAQFTEMWWRLGKRAEPSRCDPPFANTDRRAVDRRSSPEQHTLPSRSRAPVPQTPEIRPQARKRACRYTETCGGMWS